MVAFCRRTVLGSTRCAQPANRKAQESLLIIEARQLRSPRRALIESETMKTVAIAARRVDI
jgi:hypothetical protein